jgi:hypothetical protein
VIAIPSASPENVTVPRFALSVRVCVGLAAQLIVTAPDASVLLTVVGVRATTAAAAAELLEGVRVEKLTVPGVVPPIVPGAANVAPFRLLAFKFATLVALLTVKGAVPVLTDEVRVCTVTLPEESVVNPVFAPKEPLALYWTWLLDPAGAPPAPNEVVDPLILASRVLVEVLYQISPFASVPGLPAMEPTLMPDAVELGLNVWSTPAGKAIAPLMVGVAMVGEVNVCPLIELAFRLGTFVALATVNGGVPVPTTEINVDAVRLPVASALTTLTA